MLAYLHIPYCDSKCHYCSFNSYVDKFDTRKAYMQALKRQLEFELERFEVKKGSIETLFIGGGTPSTVAPKLYEPIFALLKPYLQQDAEITTEANPNSATTSWIEGMKALGVNRISFGVQSFDEKKLEALGRAHNPIQAKEAIIRAHDAGIEHISLDLIYNYRNDTKTLLHSDIDQAFELPIDHISAYELTIEDGTKFTQTPEVRQENELLAFYVADEIRKRGFEHYEISNFGHYQSKHNKGYWELKDYIGAGAGAVGFLKERRFYPQNDIQAYISDPLKIIEEALNSDDLLTERLFLGLRSNIGIESNILNESMKTKANTLVEENKLRKEGSRYFNENYFLSDELALYILG
ncbi:radical SAM family heme chaperone HemW [Sulfurovum sp. zt1-1]|uniref:Heme chaperone HemW n=1 Tax=Sulfurovum zhangzhouensis TaxID=3019067 RepID=A0ABT7R0T7_9BACT|nr:radical SAM family heme chaperone HemW [Sulfurovum zhangzhouensis]MDM5272697.1 radical SAM family heme chaperone HemW [Sulfurovum zhangzhouensis]